jgi:hypothetical protein
MYLLRRSERTTGIVLATLIMAVCGCSVDDGGNSRVETAGKGTSESAIEKIMIAAPENPSPAMKETVNRFKFLIEKAFGNTVGMTSGNIEYDLVPSALIFSLGKNDIGCRVIPSSETAKLSPEGYIVRENEIDGTRVIAADGNGLLGEQYAVYALLEEMGFGFFHPEETFVPGELEIPARMDIRKEPFYPWRGVQIHTMHPIELMDTLLVPSEEHLAEAKRYVDWLVANRQNFFLWVLQDTIDVDEWLAYAAEIVNYAHSRGVRVGIDTPLKFIQQNAYPLAPKPCDFKPQIRKNIANLMKAGWDAISVELGSAEMIPADDVETLDMLNYMVDMLDREYHIQMLCKIHCTLDQKAEHFGNMPFNFIPGLADKRLIVLPHTVQFYDLYRKASSYGNDDFSEMRKFLYDEVGERTVVYHPESAYWCSFDADVPLFLPQYVYSRWSDLNNLMDSGMKGQILFSSGFEWGYWMNDWAAARFSYEPDASMEDQIGRFSRIFGVAGEGVKSILLDMIAEQGKDLLEENMIAYLIGWDTADDAGDILAKSYYQPRRIHFREVRKMNASELDSFEKGDFSKLVQVDEINRDFARRIKGLESQIPAEAAKWYREVRSAIEVTSLRASHMRLLYEGTIMKTRAVLQSDKNIDDQAKLVFSQAVASRKKAQEVIWAQEKDYRFDVNRIARPRENPTSYEYGYLYTTSDCYYFKRDEMRAIYENDCMCLGNINHLMANMFGEGHLMDMLFRNSIPILGGCLNQCLNPVKCIDDVYERMEENR